MRILHVEDDQDTRTLVAFVLESEGWEVVSVEKASPALELAAAGGFDLYLLDNWIEGDTRTCCAAACVQSIHTLRYFSILARCSHSRLRLRSTVARRDIFKSRVLPEALVAEILKLTRPG